MLHWLKYYTRRRLSNKKKYLRYYAENEILGNVEE